MGYAVKLQKKSGSKIVKTTLWTNSSPSSAFGGGLVTLSDDISNYYLLEFIFSNDTSKTYTGHLLCYPDDIVLTYDGRNKTSIAFGCNTTGSSYRVRGIFKSDTTNNVSPNKLYFGPGGVLAVSNVGGQTSNQMNIPLVINGINIE